MGGSPFLFVFGVFERHRRLVLGLLLTTLTVSSLSLLRLRFDNTLDLMLPADSPALRMMTFLREGNFSSKFVISLESGDASNEGLARLIAATDDLAGSLEPPLVTKVVTGLSVPDLMTDAGVFLRYTPQILGAHDLASIDALLTPDAIATVLKQRYLQLLKPEGMFMVRAIQSDPLEISRRITTRLEQLSTNVGYGVRMESGHFVSRDGRHTLLLADTSVPLSDADGSRHLLGYVDERLRSLPVGITATVVCGHTHVVSNEDTILRDLGVILGIASTGFVVLFLAFYRDGRALLIFLVPALSGVVALALTALLFPQVSFVVLAFGPVILGIADDYGIAAYVAVRYGRNRAAGMNDIVRPMIVGAITTTGIFFAFFFSRIPAYRQLAFFCVTSIFLSLALALFVLPLCLGNSATEAEKRRAELPVPRASRRRNSLTVAAFAIFLVVAAALAVRVHFDSDVTRLDGTASSILEGEESFHRVWGTGERREATLAVVGDDYEKALEANDGVYQQVGAIVGADRVASFASVWPSSRTRTANARNWTAFWRSGREARLRKLLEDQGSVFGFTRNAFDPFFGDLYGGVTTMEEPVTNRVFAGLKERFVQSRPGRVQVVSLLPDDPALVSTLAVEFRDRPDVFLVSRSALTGVLSDAFLEDVVRTSVLAGMFIVLTAFLFLRTVRHTIVALAPALTGVIGLLGAMALLDRPLNLASLISGIVVFGLCIDFGVHVLHACQHNLRRTARTAVTLAATTTLMGAGVLLFARHPALYSVGLTLVVGVGVGYVAAMELVPALFSFLSDDG